MAVQSCLDYCIFDSFDSSILQSFDEYAQVSCLAGVTLPPVSFPKASVASFMKLGDIKPDPSDAHKTWWPLDKKFKSVDFIRQPNEVCQVTLNPNHDPLDLDKIMECFEVKLHF